MKRYIRRWIANTFGPPLVTRSYLLIARYYLCVPPVNDVIDPPSISAGAVFYAWLILSIFALDWAKSALAGFEAWALMDPRFAPRTALQLMWHTDRAWGSVSGWRDALLLLYTEFRYRLAKPPAKLPYRGPAGLWWFLAFSSFLFYAAVPLSSLTMEMKPAYKRNTHLTYIDGPNEDDFDTSISNVIAEQANKRWRLGNPTTPNNETVLYSPVGVGSGSDAYYWHTIQDVYANDSGNASSPAHEIKFFSGPEVYRRVHGSAWGLLTSLECSIVRPTDQRLKLLKVHEIDNWTAPGLNSGDSGIGYSKQGAGLTPSLFNAGTSFGVSYAFLVASDLAAIGGSDYSNAATFPTNGSFEIVLWQAYSLPFVADGAYHALWLHPAVMSSVWANRSTEYLGFGVKCSVDSSTGTADLHAERRSYSNFTPKASTPQDISHVDGLNAYPGMMALQSIVFASFTTVVLNVKAPPTCDNSNNLSSVTCNPWYGASIATGGIPILVYGSEKDPHIQVRTISPATFKFAIHKLFGEATIAMMARRGDPYAAWNAGFAGSTDWIRPLLSSPASLWVFDRKRWADTLSGFDMFRFGAEWKGAVWQFEENEFEKCPILLEVPGMIGDMESNVMDTGFIGLSKDEAKKNGSFVFARDAVV
ncbi:hypothetical protein D6C86_09743 [Aureobasidium pullulans]|uniref:Uncharacterized protein n=2 Tax=Aureobasidium pullulans TaxID=5580 RepID=A0A4S9PM11_AURPU|nr:hypothetical protein D6C94_08021 [Aureobasidium pullulans]THZ39235.1 hypothetical protein D6C87_07269 [Aureobasidium pullulans]THZ53737.1 hypothetical protein D6C86_09743 [Aureobasidium pullulans]THZ70372.1 hypothetical protein D6C88_07628 [Aureobasidium pullulans]